MFSSENTYSPAMEEDKKKKKKKKENYESPNQTCSVVQATQRPTICCPQNDGARI
jgi:hypothetical protein